MIITLIEFQSRSALLSQIEEINSSKAGAWGLAVVKKDGLKPMSNDAFLLSIKPAVIDASDVRVYVLENGDFYILWLGMQRRIYQNISSIVVGSLLRAGVEQGANVLYMDPYVMGDELVIFLKHEDKVVPDVVKSSPHEVVFSNKEPKTVFENGILKPTAEQLKLFRLACSQRGLRQRPNILVVEDQIFLRQLLKQILANAYNIDMSSGMYEGWDLYLSKAPDIVFLDIGLDDGDGHTLAQSIKRLDPTAYIVMVTANNHQDELRVALSNRVDAYVVKPYNGQQISGYIGKYMSRKNIVETRGNA